MVFVMRHLENGSLGVDWVELWRLLSMDQRWTGVDFSPNYCVVFVLFCFCKKFSCIFSHFLCGSLLRSCVLVHLRTVLTLWSAGFKSLRMIITFYMSWMGSFAYFVCSIVFFFHVCHLFLIKLSGFINAFIYLYNLLIVCDHSLSFISSHSWPACLAVCKLIRQAVAISPQLLSWSFIRPSHFIRHLGSTLSKGQNRSVSMSANPVC